MELIEAFVRNPVKVAVGVLLATLFGLVALTRMPIQLTPEVQTPQITLETLWPGASPHEVEREIIQEQEEQLKGVEGVTKMTSESMDSLGRITLEFDIGTNMQEALLLVNTRLGQVPEYPIDADEPIIKIANLSDRPIAWFILSPRLPSRPELLAFQKEHPELAPQLEPVLRAHNTGLAILRLRDLAQRHPDHPELREIVPAEIEVGKLRKFAEDFIESRLERVEGVSDSNVFGGEELEVQVVFDPQQLSARGLSVEDLREALRRENRDTSGGDYWEGKRRYVVRTLGQFRSLERVAETLLTRREDGPVYVRDVAEVRFGHKKPDGLVRRFGDASIACNALRKRDANVLEVMDGLREAMDELNRELLHSRGLQLTQVYDETEYIHSSIGLVTDNIILGGSLTMIVLMLFLHPGLGTLWAIPVIVASGLAALLVSPWFFILTLATILATGFWFARATLVIGLAIPTSIVGTFLVLEMLGRSLNVVSLAGMAFAVGMLVDNAIVVLENICRRYQQGQPVFEAAVGGTKEVLGAVNASTLTTVAIFLPIVFVQAEAGQLFGDIALAVSSAVGLSLLVAVAVIPVATVKILPRRTDSPADARPRRLGPPGFQAMGDLPGRFVGLVVALNAWLQQGLRRRLAIVAGFLAFSLGLSWLLAPKAEYLPNGNRNLIFGILLPPPGYNLDELMKIGVAIEARLRPYWDVDPEMLGSTDPDQPVIGDFFYVARGRQVFLGLRSLDPLQAGQLVPIVRGATADIPGTFAIVRQSSLFEQGFMGGRTIEVEITGPEIERLIGLGAQVMARTSQLLPDCQLRPIPSLDLSSPEVHVTPKPQQASDLGLSAEEIGYAVDALVDGAFVTDYFMGGDKIDLRIIGKENFADRFEALGALPIATPTGELVTLSTVAEIRLRSGPEQINHRERQRAVTIEVTPALETPLEEAMDRIADQIIRPLREAGMLEGGYRITLSGTADKLSLMRQIFMGRWTGWNWDSLVSVLTSQLVLVILITYLLMAALFESWLHPLVIMMSVPLGAVGGFLGLWSMNRFVLQPLDVLTMLGFVMLVGTVVNNPILIVHQALNHIREGMPHSPAVLASVQSRIRPIFMTTLTTVFGLLPLVLFPGAGSELYRGLGAVLLGGLIVSTLFSLLVVPSVFTLFLDMQERLDVIWARLRRRVAAPKDKKGPLATPMAQHDRAGPARRAAGRSRGEGRRDYKCP